MEAFTFSKHLERPSPQFVKMCELLIKNNAPESDRSANRIRMNLSESISANSESSTSNLDRKWKKKYNFTSRQGFLELGFHIGDLGCLEYIFYEKSRFFEKTFFFISKTISKLVFLRKILNISENRHYENFWFSL